MAIDHCGVEAVDYHRSTISSFIEICLNRFCGSPLFSSTSTVLHQDI